MPEICDKIIDNEHTNTDNYKDHFQKLSGSTPIYQKVAFVQSTCCQPGIATVHKLPFDPKRVYQQKVQEKKYVDRKWITVQVVDQEVKGCLLQYLSSFC